MGFELRLAMSTHSTMVLLVIVLQFSSLTLASSSPSIDQGIARAVSAQERKISRLEAKNAEQDLKIDLDNQRWDESRMGSLTTRRYNGAVVELKQGVLFLGGEGSPAETTSDFLATGSLQWQQGPRLPQAMAGFCAVPVTESSFITIREDKIHEFDAAIAGPTSEEGWRDSTLWPTLKTSRGRTPGCAKIGNKVILAGGFGGGRYLQSTTVLDITTRTISTGGDMATPRAWFNLATISRGGGDTTFAIAGTSSGVSERLNSVEEWE